jgi:alpha-glucosidase
MVGVREPGQGGQVQDTGAPWWRSAVIYQIYPRSFADSDGDGVGDLPGIRSRLPYLRELGVDAVWISPFYPSPMADAGYDVSDYRDIEPVFGTLDDADALVAEAHEAGLKVIIDLVPNHTSDEHPWFRAALAAGPGSRERARYLFREGRGRDGAEPPNDWVSNFGGPAWTRVTEPDDSDRSADDASPPHGDRSSHDASAPRSAWVSRPAPDRRGQWYLHLFDPKQPDLDWTNAEVVAEFESILRFWLDRGVDGFRIDVAHGLAKDPAMPDVAGQFDVGGAAAAGHPHWDRDEVHEVYRGWRRITDAYDGDRCFVGEVWVQTPEQLARYLRADELHTAFNFTYLLAPWDAKALRTAIDDSIGALAAVGAPATWVLSNHDVVRHVTRYGGGALGVRRARAATLLTLSLPGGAYVYQGEELGLAEVADLPPEVRQDPAFLRSGPGDVRDDGGGGLRDGCRVPIPWSGDAPPFGFGPPGSRPWLPQPAEWAELTVARQDADPGSMLALYRAALALRRDRPELGDGTMTWIDTDGDLLAFRRDPGFVCVVNVGDEAAAPPDAVRDGALLLASDELLPDGRLPGATSAWYAV